MPKSKTSYTNHLKNTLLASTGVLGLAVSYASAAPVTREVTGEELTFRSDFVTLADLTLEIEEGVAEPASTTELLVVLVDARPGSDRVTLVGENIVGGSLFGGDNALFVDSLTEFFGAADAIDPTTVDVTGVDTGFGRDAMYNRGTLAVTAASAHEQKDLNFNVANEGGDIVPVAVEARSEARARGATGDYLLSARNENQLTVAATATSMRDDIDFDIAGADVSSMAVVADARSTGFEGNRYNDDLHNVAGGTLDVSATAKADQLDVGFSLLNVAPGENVTQSLAHALGLYGGKRSDNLLNDGRVVVTSLAETKQDGWSTSAKTYTVPGSVTEDSAFEDGTAPKSTAMSIATGLGGGEGLDTLTNNGTIELSATANFRTLSVAIDDGGVETDGIVTIVEKAFGTDEEEFEDHAVAEIVGLRGDERDSQVGDADEFRGSGSITGTATADSGVTGLSLGLPIGELFGKKSKGKARKSTALNILLSGFGVGALDESSDAVAFADGIRAGAGNDSVVYGGSIDVTGIANSRTTSFSLSSFDALAGGTDRFSVNTTVTNLSTNALGTARGIHGGTGADDITASGEVEATARADARSFEGNLSVAVEGKTLQIEVPVVFSQTLGHARAVAIEGGNGADTITSTNTLTSTATADATSTDVSIGLSVIGGGGSIVGNVADKSVISEAEAFGINDGFDEDTVVAEGAIVTTATATTTTTSVGIDAVVAPTTGFLLGAGFVKADQSASATSIGINRTGPTLAEVEDDPSADGDDGSATLSAAVTANATSNSLRTAVGVDGAYTFSGAALTVPVISSANTSMATAGGLLSYGSEDSYSGAFALNAVADADARTNGGSASIAVAANGVGGAGSALLVQNVTNADAFLLRLGGGADLVENGGLIFADADADAIATNVGVTASGTTNGVALGANVIESDNAATAVAHGVEGGAGADMVVNDGVLFGLAATDAEIKADAFANAISTGVAVNMNVVVPTPAGAGVGLAAGASVISAATTGEATAVAADLGADDDVLVSNGKLTAIGHGKAQSNSVAFSASGSLGGWPSARALPTSPSKPTVWQSASWAVLVATA